MSESNIPAPEIYSVTKTLNLSSAAQAALKFSGIEQFKSPGPESNYLNRKFVVGIHLRATKVNYVLVPIKQNLCPNTCSQDNTAVCAVLTCTSHSSKFCYIRKFEDNTAGMWAALMAAHQDSSSGGCIYWLRKSIQTQMIGNEINSDIEKMGEYAENLNALVTFKNPLTADDIHSTAILISLPDDWLNCVSAMMN